MGRSRKYLVATLLLAGLALAAVLLAGGCAAFGGRPDGERQVRIERSPEWQDGHFVNAQPMWTDLWGATTRMFEAVPGDVPEAPVPVVRSDGSALRTLPASGLRVTWFGHSSTLIEIDGVRVLTDPIWSERPSPVPALGPKRFFAPPIPLAGLPPIDAVVISHDHYDHLDHATVVALRETTAVFVVPLGIGAHLARWGVPAERIVELDWWQSTTVGALTVTSTPVRHASGRLSPQSDRTLWSGFALVGPAHRAFYSGDTGLLPSMQAVGERFGPFDVALVEAGQYDAGWPDWHLGPEQAVTVDRMVRAKVLIPVHWGLFKLAHHTWTEPVERVLAAAACSGTAVMTPRPGESVEPSPEAAARSERWWPRTAWRDAASAPIVATRNGLIGERFEEFRCAPAAGATP